MPQASYAQFIAEHDEIDRQCQDLIRAAEAAAPTSDNLSERLERLERTVAQHLAAEEPLLPVLLGKASAGKPEKLAEVETMQRELETLKADWMQYLAVWTRDAIAADRTGFCDASSALLSRIRARVARESSLMYAAFLQTSIISFHGR